MKTKYIISLSIILYIPVSILCQDKHTVSGYITDVTSGELLINATVYVDQIKSGTVSNTYGYYSLTLDEGSYDITYSYLGYNDISQAIILDKNRVTNIELVVANRVMREVIISANEVNENVEDVGMSRIRIDVKAVKKMPALLGEVDIIKAIQLLPGVATVGEGTSGFYVRGGNADQNLILLDEAPVYNASHLLGFFSVFNADAIKDIQLYKGAIPAEYGGRLSSVLDIKMKEGNSKKFSGIAGIGTVSSRLTLESPIGNIGSFMVSGRRTYADLFLKLSKDPDIKNNRLYFYDLNTKINFRLGEKDRLFFSAYNGRDVFIVDKDSDINWGNQTITLRWNHLYSPILFSNLTLYSSDFDYFLNAEDGADSYEWTSELKDYGVKYNFGAYLNPRSTLKFGMQSIFHKIEPGYARSVGQSNELEINIDNTQSLENALYLAHELEMGQNLKLNYGLRVSSFHDFGPQDVYTYGPDYNVIDTTTYSKGALIKNYYNVEPRIGLQYLLTATTSLKLSYNRTSQYIHQASNSTSASPLDIWFSSSPTVRPQQANQYAFGYFKNIDDDALEFSTEVYYKTFSNTIDFRDHAELLLNDQLEGELRFGVARAYGLELLLRKNSGRLTGWISYTLSKSQKKINEINNGNWYNAKYDKTHDIAIVASYQANDYITFSANWIYSTGSAVTLPTGKYFHLGRSIPIYSARNAERLPAYHRLDLSLTWDKKKKLFGKYDQSFLFSIYNAYYRKNTYSINFKDNPKNSQETIAEKTYLFGIIPAVTYNVKF
ncbi:MAG: TonB-dependent receptor [Saprospiraceae bacterium]